MFDPSISIKSTIFSFLCLIYLSPLASLDYTIGNDDDESLAREYEKLSTSALLSRGSLDSSRVEKENMMSKHIVISLRPGKNVSEAHRHLQTLLPGCTLEPQFRGLPPEQGGEQAVLSEMRRTMRAVCPSGMDINALVGRLQADPVVEYAYYEPQAEPARLP
jgi:hypothetical protein